VKFKKLFRILVVALTLVLLFVAIPAVPVSAAAVIDVDLEEGEIGDEITLTVQGNRQMSAMKLMKKLLYILL
jgi:hypothetical protein